MTFRTITIKTGVAQATPVVIRDMGVDVPALGGSISYTNQNRLEDAANSNSLRDLASNTPSPGAFGTLTVNDGARDIPSALVSARLDSLTRFEEDWIVIASGPGTALHSTTVVTAGGNSVTAIGP